jgi:multicomponent Na+:H+ antiporter subunit F
VTVVLAVCVGILAVAAALLVIRLTIGPTLLDRAIALDAIVTVVICGLVIEAAVNRHTTTLPILLVLTMVGFVGSVSIARFAARSTDEEAGPP